MRSSLLLVAILGCGSSQQTIVDNDDSGQAFEDEASIIITVLVDASYQNNDAGSIWHTNPIVDAGNDVSDSVADTQTVPIDSSCTPFTLGPPYGCDSYNRCNETVCTGNTPQIMCGCTVGYPDGCIGPFIADGGNSGGSIGGGVTLFDVWCCPKQ